MASTGRPPFAHEAMLRIHFLQQWFGLSDLAMEGCMPAELRRRQPYTLKCCRR